MITFNETNEIATQFCKYPDFVKLCKYRGYYVYTGVPISELYHNDRPIGIKASKGGPDYLTLDMLICLAGQVQLAVIFGRKDWRSTTWFGSEGILDGLPHLEVEIPNVENKDALCKQIFSALILFSNKPVDEAGGYTVEADFADNILPFSLIQENLVKSGMLAQDGSITPLGSQYGLFTGVFADYPPAYFLSQGSSAMILRLIQKDAKFDFRKTDLHSQLKRLRSGLPISNAYVYDNIQKMRGLYFMPLQKYFRLCCPKTWQTDSQALFRLIGQIQFKLLPDDRCRVRSFGDVLLLSQKLYNQFDADSPQYEQMLDMNLQMLRKLSSPVSQMLKVSKQKFSQSCQSPMPEASILTIPIMHYFYSACVMQKTFYPDWVLRNQLSMFIASDSIIQEYTAQDFLVHVLSRSASKNTAVLLDYFTILYDTLVIPMTKHQFKQDVSQEDTAYKGYHPAT